MRRQLCGGPTRETSWEAGYALAGGARGLGGFDVFENLQAVWRKEEDGRREGSERGGRSGDASATK